MDEESKGRDRVSITMGEPIPGEGTDVKISYKGRDYRVKRQLASAIQPIKLAADPSAQAPYEFAVEISAALLTKGGKVAKRDGQAISFPSVRVTLGSDLPEYDPALALLCCIEGLLEAAHNRLEAHGQIAALVADMDKAEPAQEKEES